MIRTATTTGTPDLGELAGRALADGTAAAVIIFGALLAVAALLRLVARLLTARITWAVTWSTVALLALAAGIVLAAVDAWIVASLCAVIFLAMVTTTPRRPELVPARR